MTATGLTAGQEIAQMRESLGWSRRKLASKYGTSTQRIKAVELDMDPKPRKEQPFHENVFVAVLGYKIHRFTRRPVADQSFDLKQQQTRILHFLDDALLGDI